MSYSNQLIASLDAALSADLSKTQWRIYAALLRQTLGFGKTVDDLSIRRLTHLTGIRQDHAKPAIKQLIATNLIKTEPGHYGERYHIKGVSGLPKLWLSSPENGENVNRDSVTNNSKPLQSKTTTQTDSPSPFFETTGTKSGLPETTEHQQVCGGGLNHSKQTTSDMSVIHWPDSITTDLQDTVSMVTQSLAFRLQQTVINVLGEMIRQHKVKTSPIQLLYALVKAANNNTLDTSILNIPMVEKKGVAVSPTPSTKTLENQSKRLGLIQHAQLLGIKPEVLAQQWGMM